MHNATVAAMAQSKPAPPPGEPSTSAMQNGVHKEGAPEEVGTAGKEGDAAAEAEEPKIGDVVMGEVEVVDLAVVEEKPAQSEAPGT